MAKATMGRARFKIQRRLGVELPGLGKAGSLERRPYAPGQHGMKRRKLSDFTIRLMEKQKVMFNYGLREKQLVTYVKKSKKRKDMAWIDAMITTLESRLDNVVFRLNFAPSIIAARQMITHGHIRLNGKKVKSPSQIVKLNDKITLSDKGFQTGNYLQAKEKPRMVTPAFLKKDMESGKEVGQMVSLPHPTDIPFEFNEQFVIEYYWKVKP